MIILFCPILHGDALSIPCYLTKEYLLLISGARCEAKTFDGERCLYGALTDEIRDILKNYKAVKVGKGRRDLYQEFLQRYMFAHVC